ncbi:hypothetical protein WR25_25461 [Diploscapter pachys]|uniref:Mss4-like protein n=1 Tax=Diploscapter pachys TaxID=2018661 RepID=A0A2A2JP96_9BILA|nr:hypothetical protein WR25_25461 [Diploscapter pachys]
MNRNLQLFSIAPKSVANNKVDKDELLNEDEKNFYKIVCRRCESVFFPEGAVRYIKAGKPIDLRVMTHQGKGEPGYEKISWWWYTEDDMAFDTIGWQTINRKKYLMCGDCELGPVGVRSEDNKRFWVAVERCKYIGGDDK